MSSGERGPAGYDWDILFWPGYCEELSQILFAVCSPAGITGLHKALNKTAFTSLFIKPVDGCLTDPVNI